MSVMNSLGTPRFRDYVARKRLLRWYIYHWCHVIFVFEMIAGLALATCAAIRTSWTAGWLIAGLSASSETGSLRQSRKRSTQNVTTKLKGKRAIKISSELIVESLLDARALESLQLRSSLCTQLKGKTSRSWRKILARLKPSTTQVDFATHACQTWKRAMYDFIALQSQGARGLLNGDSWQ